MAPTADYSLEMLWLLGTSTLLGCAHHPTVEEFLARAPFVGGRDAGDGVLRLARDHTAWFMPGGTAGYDGERFHWHRQGSSIFLEFQENDGYPDRVAILAHDGRDYLVPWSGELCAAIPAMDWTKLASTRGTLTRPAAQADPIPLALDICGDN